jgi:DNA (cytosine-5)-methyltransferase 1
MGYHRAGFDVVGVDINPQPRYPFEFHQADALEYLLDGFDVVHASPPCQSYSVTASLHTAVYPRMIEPVRERLRTHGQPYVIENVAGAPLLDAVLLCGSSFGLGVRRHRLFEVHPQLLWAPPCAHYLQPEPVDVTGTGGPAARPAGQGGGIHRKPRNLAHAREVMGIDWMSRRELAESVPPAFTEWIGEQLLAHLAVAA